MITLDHDRSQLGTSLRNVGTSLRNNGDALQELSSPDPQKLIRSSSEQPTVTILNKGKMGDVHVDIGNSSMRNNYTESNGVADAHSSFEDKLFKWLKLLSDIVTIVSAIVGIAIAIRNSI